MWRDTIFSPSFGNRPSRLVGRDDVVRQLGESLASRPGSKERAMLIIGQRGSGKTVLLWELADRAREAEFVVASPTIAAEGMLDRVIEKIQEDGERFVSKSKPRVTGGTIGALGFTAGLQFAPEVQEGKSFRYKLARLCAALNDRGKGVLILIDEVQANSADIRQLVAAYQELVGEGRNIAIAMAGLPAAVSATLNDHVLTFLNRARKIHLEPLAESEVDAYFCVAFKQLGLNIPESMRHRASAAVKGSPYLLQLIGHNMVIYADESGDVQTSAFEDALRMAQRDFENDVCETTLAAVSSTDSRFLAAMAPDDGPSSMADIAQRMGVTADYAQKYRKRMIDAGIIESAGWGKVAFAVPYLAAHLRAGGWEEGV